MEKNCKKPNEEGRFSFRGGILSYRVYGEGSPILLFQSLNRKDGECSLINRLSREFKVIVPGIPEQPKSDPNVAPPDFDGIADAAAYLLWRMEIKSLPMIGIGAGACMALTMAELYERIPQRLAFLDLALHKNGLQFRMWYDFIKGENKQPDKKNRCYPMTVDGLHIPKSSLSALSCPMLLSFSALGPVRRGHQAQIKSALPTGDVTLCDGEVFVEKLMWFLRNTK